LPNPWDAGSARLLQSMGFKALVAAAELPVNADFEHGFADEPDAVANNVTRAVETGVAGLSIEDSTGRKDHPLYDFELAVARVKAARGAIDRGLTGTLLTARSEGFFVGQPDLDETIRRLRAFAEAGADCLYAPSLPDRSAVAAVVEAVKPKPVNVWVAAPGFTVRELAALGVRRVSTGGALARAARAASSAPRAKSSMSVPSSPSSRSHPSATSTLPFRARNSARHTNRATDASATVF
jgi:methylisocitrate lyase